MEHAGNILQVLTEFSYELFSAAGENAEIRQNMVVVLPELLSTLIPLSTIPSGQNMLIYIGPPESRINTLCH